MEFDINKLESYSVNELYEKLLPISNGVCEQYKSTIITDIVYKKLVLKAIKESTKKINKQSSKNFDTYFTNKLKEIFITYILIVIKDDNNKIDIFINDYIHKNIKCTNDNVTAIKQIRQLINFFNDIDYYPKFNEYEELIKNEKISNNLKIIVNSNLTSIIHNQISKIFDNEILISFIEIYCMDNNIEIDSNYIEDDSLSDDLMCKSSIDIIRAYLKDIGKYPTLSEEEEKKLGYKILEGDEFARKTLIERNLRLAVSVAAQYIGKGLDYSDLIQEANYGLMNAVDRYDVTLGYRFSTYAIHWIRQRVTRAIQNNSRTIRFPIHIQLKMATINNARQKLFSELQREPSFEEIAKLTGYKAEKIKFFDDIYRDVLSLNEPISNESDDEEFIDFIVSDNQSIEDIAENKILHEDLLNLMDDCKLNSRQKQVLILHYMEDENFADIARKLHCSREFVRQIHNGAIKRLLKSAKIKKLATYLDNSERAVEKVVTEKKSKDYNYEKYVYSKRHKNK